MRFVQPVAWNRLQRDEIIITKRGNTDQRGSGPYGPLPHPCAVRCVLHRGFTYGRPFACRPRPAGESEDRVRCRKKRAERAAGTRGPRPFAAGARRNTLRRTRHVPRRTALNGAPRREARRDRAAAEFRRTRGRSSRAGKQTGKRGVFCAPKNSHACENFVVFSSGLPRAGPEGTKILTNFVRILREGRKIGDKILTGVRIYR